ncbi:MAG: hypothetical protein SGI72_09470 [Planctomycetota bacterium]|nr:hypothetical protein [Planctomycetota bacterium]
MEIPNMSSFTSVLRTGAYSFLGALSLVGFADASAITPGNVVVVRVGDAVAPLTSAAQAVFLDEFTPLGVFVQTIALPTAVSGPNQPLTNSGTATSEGFLNLSADNQYLMHAGYGTIPGTLSVASTAIPGTPRVVARIDLGGNVDTSTAITDAFSANNVRSATSDDGTRFWIAGANSGIRYAASLGATTTTGLNTTPTNNRVVTIANGQLYATAASGTFQGLSSVGTGLPTVTGTSYTILPGFPVASGPSAYDHFFADANTVYVADDRTNGNGGIQKWTLAAGTWTLQYTLATSATVGCRGLTGNVVAGVAKLFATTTTTPLNDLVTVTDTGVGSTFTVVTSAATNTVLRGVRFIASNGPVAPVAFCSGDTVGTTCLACGNNGTAGRGCANSSFANGAELVASGASSLSGDTLVLTANDIPGPGLFFQANALAGSPIPFGDGMLCAAVGIQRMGVVFPVVGSASYPGGLTPNPMSIAGAPISAGNVKHYQVWYRDSVAFCTASTFNTTNGVSVTWNP